MKVKSLLNILPWRVASGPLRGTRCHVNGTGDGVVAKLAGTYEMETYRAFEEAMRSRPSLFVDIGAAEGFYVSAFARAVPGARVIAYEAKEEWRERSKQLAVKNGVAARCEVRGFCDRKEFRRLLGEAGKKHIFILMDIEGGEFDLLDPQAISLASHVSFLVELHEPDERSRGDALAEAFRATHDVEIIWQRAESRSWRDVPSVGWRLAARLVPAVNRRLDEGRAYRMRWLHAVPRPAAGAAGV